MGGEASCSPLIRALSGEPVALDCERHQSFCFVLFFTIDGTKWLEGTGVGLFPSSIWKLRATRVGHFSTPGPLGSGSMVSPEGRPVGKNRIHWCISRWFIPRTPAKSMKGFFSDIYCEVLTGLLEAKLTKVGGVHKIGSSWNF